MLFVLFKSGSLSNSAWHIPGTEASHTNLSRVVDFTGEIYHSRETGPPEQPQREVRRYLAQSRPSAAPKKITRPSQTQFFIHLCLVNHTSTDQVTTWLRKSIAVSLSLLPAACVGLRGCATHLRNPKSECAKSESLFVGAGRNHQPLPAAPRGGRDPSLAWLVALWCSLTVLQ